MANLSFTTIFNLKDTPNKFLLIDITDYAGQGISTSYVNGCFTITSPSGIPIWTNSDFSNSGCDIYIGGFLAINQHLIVLPIGLDGLPEQGVYTLLYTVHNSNLNVNYTKTQTYNYTYVRPVVKITQSVNCFSPLFTSTDSTNYVVNTISPTIFTRDHELFYPNGSSGQGNPTISTAPSILRGSGQFFSGVQTTEITTILTYTFPDGLVVGDTITGKQNFTVDCVDICSIKCCINDLEAKVEKYRLSGSDLYKPSADIFSQVMSLVALIQLNTSCGNGVVIDGMMATIKALTNCTGDCNDCGSDDNAPILGLGTLLSDVVVTSGGAPVVVTPVVNAGVTTYVITLSSTFIAQVNAKYNTDLIIGEGSGSITDGGVVAGLKTFTINTFTSAYGITAHAGGGQGSATLLIKNKNRVDTVATDNDSVLMPLAISGNNLNYQEVINKGVSDLDVYPQAGENFYGLSVNVPITVVPGSSLVAYCFENGVWTY